jgi:hypothetical protein
MPTDVVVYYLTRPLGLAVIAAAVAVPFGIWYFVLGAAFKSFGMRPLAAGYAAALVGLALLNFASSYREFTTRVERGVFEEAGRWTIVPGWTLYTFVLSLIIVLPLLGLVAVPIAAKLLKRRRLTSRNMAVVLGIAWVSLSGCLAMLPINEWQQTHRLQVLGAVLLEFVPGILLVGLPFFAAIGVAARAFGPSGPLAT